MWQELRSSHYLFHYHEGALTGVDINQIVTTQESCHRHICAVLQVEMDIPIQYFLYDNPEEVGRRYPAIKGYGDTEPTNGFAHEPDQIHAVYNREVKCIGFHEDAHLISNRTMGKPEQSLLREGLAMWFDKTWWGFPNEAWALVYAQDSLWPGLGNLASNERFSEYSDIVTYPIAGAFVEFIIMRFGLGRFKELYGNAGDCLESSFRDQFGVSLHEFEEQMLQTIAEIGWDEELLRRIRSHLKQHHILKTDGCA